MKKIITLLCISSMILSLTACSGKTGSSSESGTNTESGVSEQSDNTAASKSETAPATKPAVLKEGKLLRKATYTCEEDALYSEEIYNEDGNPIKKFETQNAQNFSYVTEYEYDSNKNMIKETKNENGEITINEYDENGVLILVKHKFPERSEFDPDQVYTTEYDESGSHVTCKDKLGKVVREVEFSDGKKTKETEYRNEKVFSILEYDSNGNEIYSFKDYEADGVPDEEYVREYNSEGQMIKVVINGTAFNSTEMTAIYDYDAEGNNTTIQKYVNGEFAENIQNDSYEYEYDEFGNKIKSTMIKSNGTRVLYTVYEYKYD